MDRRADPPLRSLLGALAMPRWYLRGELSGPEPELERDLAAVGVGWKVVPATGHAMGLQNPSGLAASIAEILTQT